MTNSDRLGYIAKHVQFVKDELSALEKLSVQEWDLLKSLHTALQSAEYEAYKILEQELVRISVEHANQTRVKK